jgi:hypothetical protein
MIGVRLPERVDLVADGEEATMDNASDADLKQLVEDPEDAPLVEAADEELARSEKPASAAETVP